MHVSPNPETWCGIGATCSNDPRTNSDPRDNLSVRNRGDGAGKFLRSPVAPSHGAVTGPQSGFLIAS